MRNHNPSPWRPLPRIICGTALAAVSLAAGCGVAPPVTGRGTVTLAGQPLAEGTIDLIPQPGTPGPAATVKIVQGKFEIPAAAKLQPGEFRVEITADRALGKQKTMNIVTGKEEEVESYESIVPERYNRESSLTAKFSVDAPNELAYDLESK